MMDINIEHFKRFKRSEQDKFIREYMASIAGKNLSEIECDTLGLLFFHRDKTNDKDIEMMAVMRGIIQGLKLYRQMIFYPETIKQDG
jgi:hypothetical protein